MAVKYVDNEPVIDFHPAPSIGHEIGIIMGFMAFFVVSMGVYYVIWQGQSSLLMEALLFIRRFAALQ